MTESVRLHIEVTVTADAREQIDRFSRNAAGELRTLAWDMGCNDHDVAVTVTATQPS